MAKKHARKQAAEEKKRAICFIMSPFDEWHDLYCKEIYSSAIHEAGLKAQRADDLFGPAPIMGDIWRLIRQSKLVLANVSGRNPNVMYELGLAHALAKPAILLTDSIADVPFDLKALRVLDYDTRRPDWAESLRKRIQTAIKAVLTKPARYVPLPFIDERPRERSVKLAPKQREQIRIEQHNQTIENQLKSLEQQLEPPAVPYGALVLGASELTRLSRPYEGIGKAVLESTRFAEIVRKAVEATGSGLGTWHAAGQQLAEKLE